MNKRHSLLALVLLLPACGRSTPIEPINIGHIGALSGPERGADVAAAQGLRLALLDAGGIDIEGRPLQIRHTDTRGALDAYDAQAVRLVYVSRAAFLYGGDTPAEVLRLDRSRVPVLTPCGFRPAGLSKDIFSLGLTPAFQGRTLARFAMERLSVVSLLSAAPNPLAFFLEAPHVVLIKDETSAEAEAVARAFSDEWETRKKNEDVPLGSPVILTFGKEKPWKEIAEQAQKGGISCLVFAGKAEDFSAFLERLTPKPALVIYGGADGSLADAPAGQAVYRVTAFAANAEDVSVQAFARKYRDAYKSEPTVQAALAYDGLRLLIEGMKRAVSSDTSTSAELRKLNHFAGVTGNYSFTPEQTLRRPAYLVRQERGAMKVEGRIEPD
ncbi:MAG: ABC transporter substrate-binding protein [Gemmataceae bacterium]